ncbi:MAG: hypothetical protein QGH45_24900, partial [Myxococcota bacterium]|nr:hypothetical protein [Myxococcota bacterium]
MDYRSQNAFAGGGGFGSRLTRTGWILVGVYFVAYAVSLFVDAWLDVPLQGVLELRALWPLDASDNVLHQPWRLVTHHILHPQTDVASTVVGLVVVMLIAAVVDLIGGRLNLRNKGVMYALAIAAILLLLFFGFGRALAGLPTTLLMLYFFSAQVERYFGTRRFVTIWVLTSLGGAVVGQLLSGFEGLDANPLYPQLSAYEGFVGPMPALMALIVLFGLVNRDARILLMMMLPVRAVWVSIITALTAVLALLSKSYFGAGYWCGGILVGFLFFRGWLNLFDFRWLLLKAREQRLKR